VHWNAILFQSKESSRGRVQPPVNCRTLGLISTAHSNKYTFILRTQTNKYTFILHTQTNKYTFILRTQTLALGKKTRKANIATKFRLGSEVVGAIGLDRYFGV